MHSSWRHVRHNKGGPSRHKEAVPEADSVLQAGGRLLAPAGVLYAFAHQFSMANPGSRHAANAQATLKFAGKTAFGTHPANIHVKPNTLAGSTRCSKRLQRPTAIWPKFGLQYLHQNNLAHTLQLTFIITTNTEDFHDPFDSRHLRPHRHQRTPVVAPLIPTSVPSSSHSFCKFQDSLQKSNSQTPARGPVLSVNVQPNPFPSQAHASTSKPGTHLANHFHHHDQHGGLP